MNLRDVFLCVGLVLLTFQSAICDDVFPTYRDDIVDQARNIITLTGTSANYTFNFAGPIMLAISFAAAVCLWGYLYIYFDKKPFGNGGGDYYKRSAEDLDLMMTLPMILYNLQRKFEEADVYEMDCRLRIICEVVRRKSFVSSKSNGRSIYNIFSSVASDKILAGEMLKDEQGQRYFEAWSGNNKGKSQCKLLYNKCPMSASSINKFIISE